MNRRLVIFALIFSPLCWLALAAGLVLWLSGCASAWPDSRTVYIPDAKHAPLGTFPVVLSKCCGSMRPAIQGGELAFAELYRGQPLLGHVVSTDAVTHRVVAESATHVILSGDANPRSDGWIPKSRITYVVTHIVRPR